MYLNAIFEFLGGYKALKYLLEGLFSISFNNPVFKGEVVTLLNSKFKK